MGEVEQEDRHGSEVAVHDTQPVVSLQHGPVRAVGAALRVAAFFFKCRLSRRSREKKPFWICLKARVCGLGGLVPTPAPRHKNATLRRRGRGGLRWTLINRALCKTC